MYNVLKKKISLRQISPFLTVRKRSALRPPTATSIVRYWGLRALVVMAGFAPFLILEIALRIFWTPLPTAVSDPFLDCSQFSSLFELNGDVYRIPRERMRLFAPAEFPVRKEPNVQRIFCIGGSTTQGEPFKPPTAFPEWMRLNLQLIAPDHKWEVINCGGLSYASYRMLPILIEVLQYQPDLVVIDCGHNEFLEKRDLSGWSESQSGVWLTMRFLRRSRVVQLASSCCQVLI